MPYRFWGQKVKSQGHNAYITENGFQAQLLSLYTYHHETSQKVMQTPHEARMCPIDFDVKRSKVKVTMEILISWKIVPAGGICPGRTAPI